MKTKTHIPLKNLAPIVGFALVVGCRTEPLVWEDNPEGAHASRMRAIAYYEKDPQALAAGQVLTAANCLLAERKIEKASVAYGLYTLRCPGDYLGWRGLGTTAFLSGDYADAINAYKKADELRDPEAARVLAIAYAGANQWTNVVPLAPRLLAYANASYPDSETRYGVAVLLAAASTTASSDGKRLLSEAVALLPQEPAKWSKDAMKAVKHALESSGDKVGLERLKQGLSPVDLTAR